MSALEWIITGRGVGRRPNQYEPVGFERRIGVRRHEGNRPLRPYFICGPATPDEERRFFRTLDQAKAAVAELIEAGEVA